MSHGNTFHLSTVAAETYERQRVPAIFGPMAEATLDAISLPSARTVLDVACGTGVMARAVGARLTAPARIVGCDLNPAMVEVARAHTPRGPHRYEWIEAPAQSMPLGAGEFDLAFCQHGLQFFPDKPAALGEMRRTLKPGAVLVVTCWKAIPPFFAEVAKVLRSHVGDAAAATAVRPFTWNDADEIRALIAAAGFSVAAPKALSVARRLRADPAVMRDELLSTPNEPALRAAGEAVLDAIVSEVLEAVAAFREGERLAMPQEALLFEAVTTQRRRSGRSLRPRPLSGADPPFTNS